MPESHTLYCRHALLPEGWAERVTVTIDGTGTIAAVARDVTATPAETEILRGVLVPGIPNCHSHAFQRAMAGLTERRGGDDDSFWSWRDTVYRLLQRIGPDELQVIATQLYVEMLKLGYTAVGEFHYLHHAADGRPYADPAEMSHRVIAAASEAGIHITHLPVLYCHSDFGGTPPEPAQRRFVHTADAYQGLLQRLHAAYRTDPGVGLGAAPHSLRAVSEPLLREAIAGLDDLDSDAPIHIHIAEQAREVEASLVYSGARPVARLLAQCNVDRRWTLVHATHIDPAERDALVASGATVGLCPSTEANLGDGLFPAVEYLRNGGLFAVGSDSQVTLDPAQELRLLEYGQRLSRQRRTLLADPSQPSVGEYLFRGAVAGGARSLGIGTGGIAVGARADLVVLDDEHPALCGRSDAALIDSWVFASNSTPVKDVMVAGAWRVRNGAHPGESRALQRFTAVMKELATRA